MSVEHHELTRNIGKMEDEVTPVSPATEAQVKVRRLRLKGELYGLLTAPIETAAMSPRGDTPSRRP